MRKIVIDYEDYPICAVCDSTVQDFYAFEDDKLIIFVVECHNSSEQINFSADEILLWANVRGLEIGRVFQKEALSRDL